MTDSTLPVDWEAITRASGCGQLHVQLAYLQPERWNETDHYGTTLLHHAARGPNREAMITLLKSKRIDVNASNLAVLTPVNDAITWRQPEMLELLCSAGANLCHIDQAILYGSDAARVLIANGERLRAVRKDNRQFITPKLVAFKRGVLSCRSAVVAMMRVKRVGKLARWDKFLLKELAICIWATRYDKAWSQK